MAESLPPLTPGAPVRMAWLIPTRGKKDSWGGDSQDLASVIRFLHGASDSQSRAMTAPVKVTREEHTPQDLRRTAASMKDAGHPRRLQAISFVLDGWPRSRAAEFADVDRQTLRDWVERYNEGGVGALATFTSPGRRRDTRGFKPRSGSRRRAKPAGEGDRAGTRKGCSGRPDRPHPWYFAPRPLPRRGRGFQNARITSAH
jgi:hypothetical protein